MTAINTKLSVEDRLEIQELFARYLWATDIGDATGVAACFTETGQLIEGSGEAVSGIEGITGGLTRSWYGRGNWFKGRQHHVDQFLMQPQPDGTVKVKGFLSIYQFNVDYRTNFLFGIGTIDSTCVKENGAWLFSFYKPEPWLSEERVPWVGEKPAGEIKPGYEHPDRGQVPLCQTGRCGSRHRPDGPEEVAWARCQHALPDACHAARPRRHAAGSAS